MTGWMLSDLSCTRKPSAGFAVPAAGRSRLPLGMPMGFLPSRKPTAQLRGPLPNVRIGGRNTNSLLTPSTGGGPRAHHAIHSM